VSRRKRWDAENAEYARAKALTEVARWEDAIPFLHRVIAVNPTDVRARCELARCLYELRRHHDAIREAESALAVHPESEWAHRLRGFALVGLRRYDEAAQSFRDAARSRPDSVYPWQAFGYLAARVEYREEVLAAAKEAVRLGPDDQNAWFALGRAYSAYSDHTESAEAYRKYLSLSPQGAMGHNNLGWALLNLGELDGAEECFRRAIALNPDHAAARTPIANLATAVRMKGNVKASDELLARFREDNLRWCTANLEQQPDDPVTHDSYVFALSRIGRHDEAWDELRAGLRRFPDSKDHWESLAIWAGGRGRYKLSIYAAGRVLALDPQNARAMEHLATAQLLAGKRHDACRTADALNELVPRSPEAERALGDACLAAEDWPAALRHFEEASRLEPLNCCYVVRIGVAKARLGDREGAEAAWQRRYLRNTLDCHCAMISVFADLLGAQLP
jgi:tetratricopeptide (TPR) repeat protein